VICWTELPNTHSTTDWVLKFHLVAVVEENPPRVKFRLDSNDFVFIRAGEGNVGGYKRNA